MWTEREWSIQLLLNFLPLAGWQNSRWTVKRQTKRTKKEKKKSYWWSDSTTIINAIAHAECKTIWNITIYGIDTGTVIRMERPKQTLLIRTGRYCAMHRQQYCTLHERHTAYSTYAGADAIVSFCDLSMFILFCCSFVRSFVRSMLLFLFCRLQVFHLCFRINYSKIMRIHSFSFVWHYFFSSSSTSSSYFLLLYLFCNSLFLLLCVLHRMHVDAPSARVHITCHFCIFHTTDRRWDLWNLWLCMCGQHRSIIYMAGRWAPFIVRCCFSSHRFVFLPPFFHKWKLIFHSCWHFLYLLLFAGYCCSSSLQLQRLTEWSRVETARGAFWCSTVDEKCYVSMTAYAHTKSDQMHTMHVEKSIAE